MSKNIEFNISEHQLSSIQHSAWIVAELIRSNKFIGLETLSNKALSEPLRPKTDRLELPHSKNKKAIEYTTESSHNKYTRSLNNIGNLNDTITDARALMGDKSEFGTKHSLINLIYSKSRTSGIVVAMPHGGPIREIAWDLIDQAQKTRKITFAIDQSVADQMKRNGGYLFEDLLLLPIARSVIDTVVLDGAGFRLAARRLVDGGVVVILADIVNNLSRAVTVPWLNGARSVMRGAARLSLASNALLVAAAPLKIRGNTDVLWKIIPPPSSMHNTITSSYLATIDLWEAFEHLHYLGAAQLRQTYEIFRPAPLRELFDAIETQEHTVRALEALTSPHPTILRNSPSLAFLIEILRTENHLAPETPRLQ